MTVSQQIYQTIAAIHDAARRFAHDEFNKLRKDSKNSGFLSDEIVAKLKARFGNEMPFKQQMDDLATTLESLNEKEKEAAVMLMLDTTTTRYLMEFFKPLMQPYTYILAKGTQHQARIRANRIENLLEEN